MHAPMESRTVRSGTACAFPVSLHVVKSLRSPPSLLPPDVVSLYAPAFLLMRIPTEVPGAQVRGACYARVHPTPLSKPAVIAASDQALYLLDLDPDEVSPRGWLYMALVEHWGGEQVGL